MDVHKEFSGFLFFTTVLCFLFGIEGYNLDIRIPIIKQGTEGSFFGFSVTGHRTDQSIPSADDGFANSLMLVGAPKFNTSQPGLSKPAGGIFRCPISSNVDDCTYEEYDVGGNQDDEEDKSDQWLGVRVGSQGPGGKVGVCAHRYKTKTKTKQKVSEISGLGKCWKLNADLTPDDLGSSSEWTPCAGLESGKKNYGYCQAGTGLYMVPQSREPEQWWLAGGPGVGDWRGGIFGTTSLSEKSPLLWNIRSYLINVENEEDAQENFDKLGVNLNSYLGFSVVSGRFSDAGIQFVAGAPRSENVGAVVIFEPRLGGEVQIKKQSVIHGKYMTESFGYSLCAADLNGDGYDDLIVGAPLFYDRNTDAGGRVYIYLNKEISGDFSGVEPITLTGSLDSMFGISIINLGDLDIDGKQDIAIGSPYENNGEGAVYIYHGSEDGIKQPATQLITPSSLPINLPISRPFNYTFGYSLSGGIDLDGNDYPELVIGAFQTDSIVALRSRPIINITARLQSNLESLDANTTNCKYDGQKALCFDITVIMRQTTRSESFIERTVDVIFSIEAETERRENLRKPSRVIFEKTGKYEVTDERMTLKAIFEEDDTESEPYRVIIQKGFTDIYRPIPFRLSFQLVETEPEMPSPGEPLPDMMDYPILEGAIDGKISKDEASLSIDFEKECAKDDGVCKTDLSMTVTHNLPGDPPILTVGAQDELEIKILLKNLNEAAYDAKIEIAFPETLHFSLFAEMAIQKCSTSDTEPTLITCKLGNPYPTTMKAELYVFKFDASDVPSDSDNFTITINATAANIDTNPTDNSKVIVAEVRGITDIQISAKAELDQYFYSGVVIGESAFEFEEDIGMLVKHTWKVFNYGPGIVEQSMVTFDFPFESSEGKWLLYMTEPPQILGHTGTCDIDPMYINPVGYQKRFPADYEEADIDSDYDELVTAGPTTANIKEANNEETEKGTGETDVNQRRRRRRRDVDEGSFKRSKRKSGDGGKAKDLDCMGKGSDKPMCFQFTCTLDALYSKDDAIIVLRSRLWNSTFIEDFLDEDLVVLYSYGEVEILGTPFLTQNNTNNDRDRLPTNVKRNLDLVPPARIKWWIILLAVLGGLILLILFILILWKCGFFKRKNKEYKYAQVEQMSAAKGKMDKRIYYDDAYM